MSRSGALAPRPSAPRAQAYSGPYACAPGRLSASRMTQGAAARVAAERSPAHRSAELRHESRAPEDCTQRALTEPIVHHALQGLWVYFRPMKSIRRAQLTRDAIAHSFPPTTLPRAGPRCRAGDLERRSADLDIEEDCGWPSTGRCRRTRPDGWRRGSPSTRWGCGTYGGMARAGRCRRSGCRGCLTLKGEAHFSAIAEVVAPLISVRRRDDSVCGPS